MDIYSYQKPLGKIQDDPQLRGRFITLYDTKSHQEIVRFCIILGRHLIDTFETHPSPEIVAGFEAMQEWLDGSANYHKARNLSFAIGRFATTEKDPIKSRFMRTMAQIIASPHVKYHGLWATDFAITLVNRISPGDTTKVQAEREFHISTLMDI